MGYVIEPLSKKMLLSFFDDTSIAVIKYFMTKALFSQPEVLPGQKPLPVQVPKEHIEQWFTQGLQVKPVGAGSYPIDIYNDLDGWGADIKMLSVKLDKENNIRNAESGEASLGQNFRDAGIDLDDLFASRKYNEIKEKWVQLYRTKFNSVSDKYKVNKFYYFFILRTGPSFHLVGASINLDNLKNVDVNDSKTSESSVFINGFMEATLGNTKIYKAKKRLELRLRPKKWVDNGYSLKFETNFSSIEADLRKLSADPELLNKELERLKNITINIV